MNPEEVLALVRPFFPQDFATARGVIAKEFPELPEWLSNAITFMLFESLEVERLQTRYPQMLEDMRKMLPPSKKAPEDEEPIVPKVNFNTYIYML